MKKKLISSLAVLAINSIVISSVYATNVQLKDDTPDQIVYKVTAPSTLFVDKSGVSKNQVYLYGYQPYSSNQAVPAGAISATIEAYVFSYIPTAHARLRLFADSVHFEIVTYPTDISCGLYEPPGKYTEVGHYYNIEMTQVPKDDYHDIHKFPQLLHICTFKPIINLSFASVEGDGDTLPVNISGTNSAGQPAVASSSLEIPLLKEVDPVENDG